MPKLAAGKRRSGDDARGSARLNANDELPHTNTTAWRQKFMGRTSTAEALGDDLSSDENGSPNPRPYSDVATTMKQPLSERAGVGHGGGKHPRTVQRREARMLEVLAAEVQRRKRYLEIELFCKQAMSRAQEVIVAEATRLGYSEIHMYVKYQAVRIYFSYLAEGHSAIAASEAGGWPSMYSGSTVREWANDFMRACTKASWALSGTDFVPKDVMTFSPYARYILLYVYLVAGLYEWCAHILHSVFAFC
jgi:hypothetical protein